MAVPTPHNVASFLCSDTWTWSPTQKCTVKFNEDGTGELLCSVEFNLFIASEFDWEMRSEAETTDMARPVDMDVTLTLTEREMKSRRFPVRPAFLSIAAFRQQTYHLQLEKGSFKVENRTSFGSNPTYEYRLLWNKSPYPPLEEWKVRGPAQAGKYWERNDFYKGVLKD